MSITVEVDGVDVSAYAQPVPALGYSLERPTLSVLFRHGDAAAGWRPAQGDEIIFYDGATPIWGGVLREPAEDGDGEILDIQCEADGFAVYLDYPIITWSQAAGMHERDAVDYLVTNYLAAYGITRDPAMAEGDELPALSYEDRTAEEILQQIGLFCEHVRMVDPSKVLSMITPGSVAGPGWAISDATSHIIGKPNVRRIPQGYADAVKVKYGSGVVAIAGTDLYEGDGSNRTFVLAVPSATGTVGSVGVPGPAILPCGVYGIDDVAHGGPLVWTYQASTHSLIHDPSVAALTAGQYVQPYYNGSFPGTVTSSAGSGTPRWASISVSDVYDKAAAEAIALKERTKRQIVKREMRFTTTDAGLAPGQSLAAVLSRRAVNATYLVTEVTRRILGPAYSEYDVVATEGTTYLGSASLDYFRGLSGSGSTSMVAGGGGGGGMSSALHAHLGGSRTQGIATAVGVPIINYSTFTAPTSGSYTFRVEVQTTVGTTTVQAYLYDVTAAATVAGSTTTASGATTWTEFSQPVTLVAGHRYRAEMVGSDAAAEVLVGQATMVM